MKNNFIKSTIILVIFGLITKVLGMVIKICLTRVISTHGIGIYSLILPTFNLFITLCSMGIPIAISKLISENKYNGKLVVLPIIPIILFVNVLLIILLIIIAPFVSNNLLKNSITYYPIVAIGITLPFICISSILKGYFFGKQEMFPSSLSNIIEQFVRLLLTIFLIPKLIKYGYSVSISGVVLINVISEFFSIICLLFFVNKNIKINLSDFKYNSIIFKDIISVSLPSTGSRLIGSFSMFLEPIIITLVLLKCGYSNKFITYQYGIINGYVYPLLLLPSFFSLAISNALMPVVSNYYSHNNLKYTKYKIKQAIIISLIIGIPCTFLFISFPHYFLKLIYNTNEGIVYIKYVAPVFLLFYIQGPLTSSMQGMNMAKEAMYGTLIGAILKNILLFTLSFLHIGIWGLIISNSFNIVFVTLHHLFCVYLKLKK